MQVEHLPDGVVLFQFMEIPEILFTAASQYDIDLHGYNVL